MATITDDTVKDVAYYLQHPDEVDPSNTELVQKIIAAASDSAGTTVEKATEGAGKDDDAANKKAEEEAQAKAAAEAEAAAKAKAEADAAAAAKAKSEGGQGKKGAEAEEAPVLAKDGKSVIPHAVLRDEREGRAAAEGALREAMAANLAMKKQLDAVQAGRAAGGDGGDTKTVDELEAELEKVREDAPWAVPLLEKTIAAVRASEAKIAELEAGQIETEEAAIASLQKASQTALDGNATLTLWKSQRPDLYDEAVAQDELTRRNPKLAQRFMDDEGRVDFTRRFDHVVKLVKAAHDGEDIPLPQPVPSSDVKDPKPGAPAKAAPDSEKVKAAAAAKLKEAADAGAAVTSLTDIPGGAAAAQSEEEAIEAESVQALGNRLFAMTPDKLAAFLARNG